MSDLAKRLRIKAGMIEMGERIAWGSDSALMREAADALELAAPAVQGEVGEGAPDYINDAIDNLAHDNYRLNHAGYQERLNDIALIRAYVARTGQPAEQQPDVTQLVEALARCRHEASYSIGEEEALSIQLGKVRDIVNQTLSALAPYRKGGEA